MREGLLARPSDELADVLGHELFHVEQVRSIPNFQAVYDSVRTDFGLKVYEVLAAHRGSMFSGVPMSPIYNFLGLPQP